MNKLGKNLIWALSDIGDSDAEFFSADDYELHGETAEGADCSSIISVIDACKEASEKLREQEKEMAELKANSIPIEKLKTIIKNDNETFGGFEISHVKYDLLKLIKGVKG